jgi:hypothetical protein
MLFTDYLIGRYVKSLLSVSLLFFFFTLAVQLFNTFHLLFTMPLGEALLFLLLLGIYTYILALSLSMFVAGGNLIYQLKEHKIFYVFYTFGVSDRKILLPLQLALVVLSLVGAAAAYVANYQKVSHVSKYLKFQFGKQILLTVPPRSFFAERELSFFFERREGNRFYRVVVKTGDEIVTAKEARLTPEGFLLLKKNSLFTSVAGYNVIMRSDEYKVGLGGGFFYKPPRKKFIKDAAFGVALFLFPPLVFPLFFFLLLRRVSSRFASYMWALAFTFLQFAFALTVKALI